MNVMSVIAGRLGAEAVAAAGDLGRVDHQVADLDAALELDRVTVDDARDLALGVTARRAAAATGGEQREPNDRLHLASVSSEARTSVRDWPTRFERCSIEQLDSNSLRHQAANVRTTLTLDPDLAKKLKDLAHRRGQSFKQTLNDVVRRGLSAREREARRVPYVLQPHHGGFRAGIDPGKLNELIDQLETETFVEKSRR